MKTQVFNMKDNQINLQDMKSAADMIRKGGLVAFPTETVYGLGGDATSPDASRKIYEAKGRPSDNPLIVHIADFSQLVQIVDKVPPEAELLAKKFWPGPLTMILNKNEMIPYETVQRFVHDNSCTLDLVEGAHHWIHLDHELDQMHAWEDRYL